MKTTSNHVYHEALNSNIIMNPVNPFFAVLIYPFRKVWPIAQLLLNMQNCWIAQIPQNDVFTRDSLQRNGILGKRIL